MTSNLSKYLTYAGSLPFVFCALALLLGGAGTPHYELIITIAISYGLLIISYMSGVYWGLHLKLDARWQVVLPVLSNVMALMAWVSFLFFPLLLLPYIFSVLFIALLVFDHRLLSQNVISQDYWRLRRNVTLIVCVALLIIGFVQL